MNDEKTMASPKRKNRLNLIDVLLIVLLVLFLGVLLAYRFFVAGDAGETVHLEYSIEIPDVGKNVNTAKLAGDVLYNDDDIMMGTVVGNSKVNVKTRTVTIADMVYCEEKVYYMTVTVECEATRMKNGGYRVNGALLSVGDELLLYSNDFVIEGTCIRATEVIK